MYYKNVSNVFDAVLEYKGQHITTQKLLKCFTFYMEKINSLKHCKRWATLSACESTAIHSRYREYYESL